MKDTSQLKAAIIRFPGSNCDFDCQLVLESVFGIETHFIWHTDCGPVLDGFDFVILPGGFSYGDYLRCGAMAAKSNVMRSLKSYALNGGYVLGICNGFQILCEAGLLPGGLRRNKNLKFLCHDVTLEVTCNESPWTNNFSPHEKITLPIAHADGCYVIPEKESHHLINNNQILLTYSTSESKKDDILESIQNPNGSFYSIAGICNEGRNIFGLMPHPERATDLGSHDGRKIWQSLIETIQTRHKMV